MGGLAACGPALPAQVPQHRKVVGGGRRVGQLWRCKDGERVGGGVGVGCSGGVRSDRRVSVRVQLRILKFGKKNYFWMKKLNSAQVNIVPEGPVRSARPPPTQ